MSMIKCDNISLSYENNIVLTDLSFEVNSGDYLCIVGENGSGKSTLIKALLSLKGLSGGKITFGDGLKQNEIGYLPQHSSVQKDFPANVWEVVISGCLNSHRVNPFYTKSDKTRALNNLEKLGIAECKNRFFSELSGGQQQRVLLARALCATHKLLLLDEPVAGLDPIVTQELYQIFKRLNDEGITIIMVSHDLESAVSYASHILHLHNKPLFFGRTEDYIKSDAGKIFMYGNKTE
ncbi:MAG: metal ABC transporter ATP-binding protein [Clostridiales bacterium]|nr:metal ABC transporter ATP-binding protein [Clostridiales bacterium]